MAITRSNTIGRVDAYGKINGSDTPVVIVDYHDANAIFSYVFACGVLNMRQFPPLASPSASTQSCEDPGCSPERNDILLGLRQISDALRRAGTFGPVRGGGDEGTGLHRSLHVVVVPDLVESTVFTADGDRIPMHRLDSRFDICRSVGGGSGGYDASVCECGVRRECLEEGSGDVEEVNDLLLRRVIGVAVR